MKKLMYSFMAILLCLGLLPSYSHAQAADNSLVPQVQVKLRYFLGNQSSISLKINGSYYLNGSAPNLLVSNRNYTVKVENGSLGLYDGDTKLASGGDLSITPVSETDHVMINDREYAGGFHFIVENNLYVRPINIVNLEDYVKGVVPNEIIKSWPIEAQKAQAVAARTYAYYRLGQTINDTTTYQLYGGVTSLYPTSTEAVDATTGELLTFGGKVIDAVFSSSNGGITENKFDTASPVVNPYVSVQPDPYDTTINWNVTLHKQQLDTSSIDLSHPDNWWDTTSETDPIFSADIKAWLNNNGYSNKQIKIVAIPKLAFYAPSDSGRFFRGDLTIQFFVKDQLTPNGELDLQTVTITNELADNIRTIIGSKYMKSNLFKINGTNDAYTISGSGYGHGVGMSQYGAYGRASAGILYKDILSFYYPGTLLVKQYTPNTNANPPVSLTVNPIGDTATQITGSAGANTIIIAKAGEREIGRTNNPTGIFTIPIEKQPSGTTIQMYAEDADGNVVSATNATVKDTTVLLTPTVNQVSNQDSVVSGQAGPGTKIVIKANSTVIGSVFAGHDGKFTVPIPVQKAGTTLAIVASDPSGNTSKPVFIVVKSEVLHGWVKQNGFTYYYDLKTAKKVTGWLKLGTTRYYFNGNGVIKTGWFKAGNTSYYFDASGKMKTGWQKIGARWYYFDGNGKMKTGWVTINAKRYYFSSSGVWVK